MRSLSLHRLQSDRVRGGVKNVHFSFINLIQYKNDYECNLLCNFGGSGKLAVNHVTPAMWSSVVMTIRKNKTPPSKLALHHCQDQRPLEFIV